MKLFQIEEPDGSPLDADGPGAAIGIDVGGTVAEVACRGRRQCRVLPDRDGFAPISRAGAGIPGADWRALFECALRAEQLWRGRSRMPLWRCLARRSAFAARLASAAPRPGSRCCASSRQASGAAEAPALAAAMLAEDLAPRSAAP